jgi:hypothetical protein
MFQVEVVWNREFNWVHCGTPHDSLDEAIQYARLMEESGDGARVKKTRIVDSEDKVVWQYGKEVK